VLSLTALGDIRFGLHISRQFVLHVYVTFFDLCFRLIGPVQPKSLFSHRGNERPQECNVRSYGSVEIVKRATAQYAIALSSDEPRAAARRQRRRSLRTALA